MEREREFAAAGATTTAIVRAVLDDDNGDDSGSVCLFDAAGTSACRRTVMATQLWACPIWSRCSQVGGPYKGCPADFDGNDGVSDLLILLDKWG